MAFPMCIEGSQSAYMAISLTDYVTVIPSDLTIFNQASVQSGLKKNVVGSFPHFWVLAIIRLSFALCQIRCAIDCRETESVLAKTSELSRRSHSRAVEFFFGGRPIALMRSIALSVWRAKVSTIDGEWVGCGKAFVRRRGCSLLGG